MRLKSSAGRALRDLLALMTAVACRFPRVKPAGNQETNRPRPGVCRRQRRKACQAVVPFGTLLK
jgi:hypothetical protein